jgi:multimeric flavodoxin WrbA
MKTVILFGSPRKNGNTRQLVDAASETLKEKRHDVRMLFLNDLNIRPCQGCHACLSKGICRINDDMKDIRKYMIESDLIIYATPVYWFGPSGQLKLVMDRSISFMDNDYNSRIKGKQAITLVTLGDENLDTVKPLLSMFQMTFDFLGLSYKGHIEVPGCMEKGRVKKAYIEKTKKLIRSLL